MVSNRRHSQSGLLGKMDIISNPSSKAPRRWYCTVGKSPFQCWKRIHDIAAFYIKRKNPFLRKQWWTVMDIQYNTSTVDKTQQLHSFEIRIHSNKSWADSLALLSDAPLEPRVLCSVYVSVEMFMLVYNMGVSKYPSEIPPSHAWNQSQCSPDARRKFSLEENGAIQFLLFFERTLRLVVFRKGAPATQLLPTNIVRAFFREQRKSGWENFKSFTEVSL